MTTMKVVRWTPVVRWCEAGPYLSMDKSRTGDFVQRGDYDNLLALYMKLLADKKNPSTRSKEKKK